MCKINHFGFDKHPMFYYICDSFHDVCQVFIWQAKNTTYDKTLISVDFFEHMVPVIVSNRYRNKQKRKLNK